MIDIATKIASPGKDAIFFHQPMVLLEKLELLEGLILVRMVVAQVYLRMSQENRPLSRVSNRTKLPDWDIECAACPR